MLYSTDLYFIHHYHRYRHHHYYHTCSLMSVARVHMFVIPGKHLTWLTKGTHSRKINLPPHSPSRSLYWAPQYPQTWKMLVLRLWMYKTEYSSHYCTKSIFSHYPCQKWKVCKSFKVPTLQPLHYSASTMKNQPESMFFSF